MASVQSLIGLDHVVGPMEAHHGSRFDNLNRQCVELVEYYIPIKNHAWSNDRLHAPSHGVTMKGDKDRYTLAQFSMMKETVETPEELVDQEHPSQFKPFDHFEYLEFYGRPENRMLESAIRTYCGI
ncbi:hypothetical protein ACSBR1_043355 [Camellia fascicularis]